MKVRVDEFVCTSPQPEIRWGERVRASIIAAGIIVVVCLVASRNWASLTDGATSLLNGIGDYFAPRGR